jgi:hypothetical protein
MENIFGKNDLLYYYFNVDDISIDLHFYLYNKLFNENNAFRLDLQTALTINANE